jgi:membrane fusion protein, macrolide-specific efflux system
MTNSAVSPANVPDPAQVRPPAPSSPPPARLPKNKLRLALLMGGGLLLMAAAYYGWRIWLAADDAQKGVITAVVTTGDLEDTITATGTLQPKEFVDVGTQVSGQLKRVSVEVGTVVKAADLLAEIDPSVYLAKVDADRAQIDNQTAQLKDKQAQLSLAELQLTRQKNMMREEATTADAVQSAEATERSARAQVESITAQREQTESTLRGDAANLSYTKIFAPIAGTVVSQTAKQGQTLNANQQAPIILRIADLSVMTVQAQVSEADVPKLKLGMAVYFTTLGGNSRRYYSRLRQIPPTPTVVNNVVLYDALFDIPNPGQTLMTQMTAQVFFVLASAKAAIQVPLTALHPAPGSGAGAGKTKVKDKAGRTGEGRAAQSADPRLIFRDGRALVSVVDQDGHVTEREVQVGVMTRVAAQITSGLSPGEVVVIGTKVAPKSDAPKPGSAMTTGQNQGGPR